MGLLRSKVAGIVFAAVLVGLTGSGLAVLTAAQPASTLPGPAGAALVNGSPASTASTAASPTGDSATPTDTAGPLPAATRTPRPTPTLPPVGAQVDLHGRVVSVKPDAPGAATGTFVLDDLGRLYTCVVTTSTHWTGTAITFAMLQPDMLAEVSGVLQLDRTFAASAVNAQLDN